MGPGLFGLPLPMNVLGRPYRLAGRGRMLVHLPCSQTFGKSSGVVLMTSQSSHRNLSHHCKRGATVECPIRLEAAHQHFSASARQDRSDIAGPWDVDFIGSEIVKLKERRLAIGKAMKTCGRILDRKRPQGPEVLEELVFTFDRYMRLLNDHKVALKALEERLDAVLDQYLAETMSSGGMGLHAGTTLPLDPNVRQGERDIRIAEQLRALKRLQRQGRGLHKRLYEWAVAKEAEANSKTPYSFFKDIQEMLGGPDSDKCQYNSEDLGETETADR